MPELAEVRHGTDRRNSDLPHLESLSRIGSIPIVESGVTIAGNIYTAVKRSNSLTTWSFETAEMSFNFAFDSTFPIAISLLGKRSINVVDRLLCKSLDILDERVPSIYLPPQMMYWNTKQYMNNKLVTPVLKRADSVKHLGNSVLTSRYTEYAADSLDNALTVADKYVEKYLPAEPGEESDSTQTSIDDANSGKAVKTIHHVDRFSRKFKRRLTQHALAEAKALKKQSKEAIHVLIYVAELIATDPKLAMQKAQELWASLSKDEPENQARPATLEQLIVMITRETARRIVHLINHTSSRVTKIPNQISETARGITIQFLHVADTLVKTARLDGVTNKAISEVKSSAEKIRAIIQFLNEFANNTLERLAITVAGRPSSVSSDSASKRITRGSKKSSPNRNKHSTTTVTTLNVNANKRTSSNHRSEQNSHNSVNVNLSENLDEKVNKTNSESPDKDKN